MDPSSVLIVKWPKPFTTRYYRNLLPDLQVTCCKSCLKVKFTLYTLHITLTFVSDWTKYKNNYIYLQLFHTDDYELALLRYNHCPFCRTPSNVMNQNS